MVASLRSQPHGGRAFTRHTRPDPRRYGTPPRRCLTSSIRAILRSRAAGRPDPAVSVRGSGLPGALLGRLWTTAPHGHGEGAAPQNEPWIPEVRVPGDRMLVGIVRSIDHTSLDEQPGDGEHTPVDGSPIATIHPSTRIGWALVQAGSRPAPTPTSTSGATAPTSFATVISHSVTTTPAERSRPQRSISPPTVSSNAVPPSAQYALIAALAAPRLAAITAATTAPRSSRVICKPARDLRAVAEACIDPAFGATRRARSRHAFSDGQRLRSPEMSVCGPGRSAPWQPPRRATRPRALRLLSRGESPRPRRGSGHPTTAPGCPHR